MDIDLRWEIDQLLDRNGYDIDYYRRTNVPCAECNDGSVNEPPYPQSETCKPCLGTGWKLTHERHRVRRDPASVPETWPRSVDIKPVGSWQAPAWLYFMKHDTNPRFLDLIVQENEILEINFADPQRRWDGRIEYYYVAVESKPTKIQLRG